MIANGSGRVNALRAIRSSSVAVTADAPELASDRISRPHDVPITRSQLRLNETRGKLGRVSNEVVANVFIELSDAQHERGSVLDLAGRDPKARVVATTALNLKSQLVSQLLGLSR